MKRELTYCGITIVLGSEAMKFTEARELITDIIILYASRRGRDVKIIFFNCSEEGIETGITALFQPLQRPL